MIGDRLKMPVGYKWRARRNDRKDRLNEGVQIVAHYCSDEIRILCHDFVLGSEGEVSVGLFLSLLSVGCCTSDPWRRRKSAMRLSSSAVKGFWSFAAGGSPVIPRDRIIAISEACALGSTLSAALTNVTTKASSLVRERVRFPSRTVIRWLSSPTTTVWTLRWPFRRPFGLPDWPGLKRECTGGRP